MSKRLAIMRTIPAQKNCPKPNSRPHPTLRDTPITVKRLWLMCPCASQRTIASMILCAARPMLAPNISWLILLGSLCPKVFELYSLLDMSGGIQGAAAAVAKFYEFSDCEPLDLAWCN